MKRKLRIVLITVLLVAAPLFMLAQTPPHPNGGNAPTGSNGPVGGGAPIDGGLSILLLATLAFSVNRYYRMRMEVSVKE